MRPLAWVEFSAFALVATLLSIEPAAGQIAGPPPPAGVVAAPVQIGQPPPAPPPPAGYLAGGVVWTARPDARAFAARYPPRAMREGVQARVVLDCLAAADGSLTCYAASEDPVGYGFGAASVEIARDFRIAPQTSSGQPTAGMRLRTALRWALG